MSEILGELAQVRSAFAKPTLALLGKKWAPVVLAVFASTFSREQESISAERFHSQVEVFLSELKSVGEPVPEDTARTLCRRWVEEKWLILSSNEEQAEEYSLTSHSQEAIDYVNRLSGDRSMFSESRIRTILDAARRCAMDANLDREERLARLDEQIARLTAERDHLAAGGEIAPVSDERIIEEYLNLRDLIAQLPADFLRVSESVKTIHRVILSEFREEGRRTGDVLDDYLNRSQDLMSSSAEGRAFTGAVELLRDDRLLKELRDDLGTILDHPFSETLTASEERDFRDTVSGIRRGIEIVLYQRSRLSSTLRTHITRHDALRDRELDDALRRAKVALADWMITSGPRTRVSVNIGLPPVDIGHLRQRFYDPKGHAPPPPLVDTREEADAPISLQDLRNQGGPSLRELRQRLGDLPEPVTGGEFFAEIPVALRRPVEILGLIQIAAETNNLLHDDLGEMELFEAIRPDGTARVFSAPRIVFDPAPALANSGEADD